MVGARPHVGEDQRPEVDDGQAVRVHGAACLLRDEVVHHPQKTRCQEETHGIVAIPPLHHGILHTGIGRVTLHPARGNGGTVDHVQQRHCQDKTTVEPVGHIDVADPALADGSEENNGIRHPDQGDQDVNRPFQLGIFLAAGVTQWQADDGGQNDQLPAPEGESCQFGHEQAGLAGALHHKVAGADQGTAAKREDHSIGVQRPQTAVTEP